MYEAHNTEMLSNPLFDYQFKVILIGDSMVGKSSLMKAFSDGSCPTISEPTIGVDFSAKTILIPSDDRKVKLQLWDTAGQEKFRSISRNYYRNVVGALILFDITKRETFEHVRDWYTEALSSIRVDNPTIIIVGNKCDMIGERAVVNTEGALLAQELGSNLYFETSALKKSNVNEVFQVMAEEIYRNVVLNNFASVANSPDWDGVKKGHPDLLNMHRTEVEPETTYSCC
ncbi:Ras- protein Rab-39B [Cichlidogyrus casuarinus]|uniref:Ras- protein Rab-39B n=1 Tax=Cichlidogyrus casuarinus TaxID=1844966 RepID=A0ABD2QBF7_9PLAT